MASRDDRVASTPARGSAKSNAPLPHGLKPSETIALLVDGAAGPIGAVTIRSVLRTADRLERQADEAEKDGELAVAEEYREVASLCREGVKLRDIELLRELHEEDEEWFMEDAVWFPRKVESLSGGGHEEWVAQTARERAAVAPTRRPTARVRPRGRRAGRSPRRRSSPAAPARPSSSDDEPDQHDLAPKVAA